jgi:hypothetical protein
VFHGGLSDAERRKLVNDFNEGRLRVALIGPSGSEGISLKGSQLFQELDPHFHLTRSRQARGRGIRFDSHVGLPEDLQNVKIQRFIAKLPLGLKDRLLQSVGFDRSSNRRAADDYLRRMAEEKDKLNQQFVKILEEVGSEDHPPKQSAFPEMQLHSRPRWQVAGAILGVMEGDPQENVARYQLETTKTIPNSPWLGVVRTGRGRFLTDRELSEFHRAHRRDADAAGVPYYFVARDNSTGRVYTLYSDEEKLYPLNTSEERARAKEVGLSKGLQPAHVAFDENTEIGRATDFAPSSVPIKAAADSPLSSVLDPLQNPLGYAAGGAAALGSYLVLRRLLKQLGFSSKEPKEPNSRVNPLTGPLRRVRTWEPPTEQRWYRKTAGVLDTLRQAKQHSDARNWTAKINILRSLMESRPQDWVIDGDRQGHAIGVTHRSGFRFHLPPESLAGLNLTSLNQAPSAVTMS